MLQISQEYRTKVAAELQNQRSNFDGTDKAFAAMWGINPGVFSRLKKGEIDGLLKDSQFLNIGRELNISITDRKWVTARTDVFNIIEDDILFCQAYSKAKICVDDCGIGKSYSAKYLSRTLKNCFYVDASQAKTKQLFVRLLAKTIGVDHNGKYAEVKANIKYYLKLLPNPIVIIDEAGDLDAKAFLELKEFWNATENACGWYMIGADGLRESISKGVRNKKNGYKEIFSRYSERYTTPVPAERQEKLHFYRKLITDVLSVNMEDKTRLDEIVKRCLTVGQDGQFGGLRRAESLLILYS